MDTRLLKCFLAVAQTGNMTQAAEAVHLSQPALSKSIQRLEEELGVELFERRPGGVHLTPFGTALRQRAKLIQLELNQARHEIDLMKAGEVGILRVGSGPLMTVLYVPDVINRMRRHQPKLRIRLVSAVLDTLVPQLLDGEVDLVCVALDFDDHPDIVKEYLLDLSHVLVARREHPLAAMEYVPPKRLAEFPWVTLSNDYVQMARVSSYFSSHGLEQPKVVVESNSLEGVLALLRSDDFVASISSPLLTYFSNQGISVVRAPGTSWQFQIGVAYRRSTKVIPMVSHFIDYLKEVIAQQAKPSTLVDVSAREN
jgi:DNA-binding transcriptional LysR family regulator